MTDTKLKGRSKLPAERLDTILKKAHAIEVTVKFMAENVDRILTREGLRQRLAVEAQARYLENLKACIRDLGKELTR